MRNKRRRRNRQQLLIETLESKRLLAGDGVAGNAGAGGQRAELAGDIDRNDRVDFADFLLMTQNFGAEGVTLSDGDANGDGRVSFPDFLMISDNFGKTRQATPRENNGNAAGKDKTDPPVKPGNAHRSKVHHGKLRSDKFVQKKVEFTDSINQQRLARANPFAEFSPDAEAVFFPILQAGTAAGSPTDSPALRIDSNTGASPYGGVGSLEVVHPTLGPFLCSGSLISSTHVLTAGHCFDLDEVDGELDDGITGTFFLNDGADFSSEHAIEEITIHPDFGGFTVDGANDDLAIVRLQTPVPPTTPIYTVSVSGMASGESLVLVGYGQSGTGDTGFTVAPTFTDKRVGRNQADLFVADDELGLVDELFFFDFDEPTGSDDGFLGGTTLGNNVETSFGGGDSGGPAFIESGGERIIAGVNTFNFAIEPTTPPAGFFGSLGGGVILATYADWIASIVPSALPSNKAPSFVKGPDQMILEDAPPQTVIAWASDISAGEGEVGQTLTFNVISNSNPSLFSDAPQVAPNGTLTYTTAANASGLAEITIELMDDGGTEHGGMDTSARQTFSIEVLPVNDAPSFVLGGDVTVQQDSGGHTFPNQASGFDPGPSEDDQALDGYVISNNNAALFLVPPEIDDQGRLTFTPADGATGSAMVEVQARDDGGIANGGVDTSPAQSFAIRITPDDTTTPPPTFTLAGDVTLNEGDGSQQFPSFVQNASPEITSYEVRNDSDHFFRTRPTIDAQGKLRFAARANAFGVAQLSVQARDAAGQVSDNQTFSIIIEGVNDAPSVSLRGDIRIAHDAGDQVIANFASDFNPGNAFEVDQAIDDFMLENDNQRLFRVQPDITNDGELRFTAVDGASGTSRVKVRVRDDGGVSNGGVDTSESTTFVISIVPKNDKDPLGFMIAGDVSVEEDTGTHKVNDFVESASSKIKKFKLANDQEELFRSQPTVDDRGKLRFAARANAFGVATVQIWATDGRGNASEAQTFQIRIRPINDAPSISIQHNIKVAQDAGMQVIKSFVTKFDPGNGFESQQTVDDYVVANNNHELFRMQPDITNDGHLSFTPAEGMTGKAKVTVLVRDSGGSARGGEDTSKTKTFMIEVMKQRGRPAAPDFAGLVQDFIDRIRELDDFQHGEQLIRRITDLFAAWDDDLNPAKQRLNAITNTLEAFVQTEQLDHENGEGLLNITRSLLDQASESDDDDRGRVRDDEGPGRRDD